MRKQPVFSLVSVSKIWDQAPHNAMTDLILFKNRWFCTFREADKHMRGQNGKIRIIVSDDSLIWRSLVLFAQEGVDLRDPKFSITPSGQLMLLIGGTYYDENAIYRSLQSRVTFSDNGEDWSNFALILEPHEWLWRVTWHQEKAYGASYSRSDISDPVKPWNIKLFESPNGIDYHLLTPWNIPGRPNETTLRFLQSNEMIALVRRDGENDREAWLGISPPPYLDWKWNSLQRYFGGPNFLVLPEDRFIVAGRVVLDVPNEDFELTIVGSMDFNKIYPALILPSGGDCSYPGMVFHGHTLWVSYYSSHEANTAIYLARIDIS